MPNQPCTAPADPRLVGDPVDTLTGAMVDRTLDFRLTGPIELRWYRHYDSAQRHRHHALGWGHTHAYDRSLLATAESIVLEEPVGIRTEFPRLSADGDQMARAGCTLQRLSLRRYAVRRHGEPIIEFEFVPPHARARPARLVQGPHAIQFQYDAALKLHRIVDSLGRVIRVDEGDDGTLHALWLDTGVLDGPALLMAYAYDERGNLVGTRNGAGHGHSFDYDNSNRMIRRRGRKGFTFRFSYDAQGRCTAAAGDDRMHGVALDYMAPGRQTRVTRPDGGAWTYHFDAAGRLDSVVDPLGGRQRYLRDESGRVTAELDANLNLTRHVHDAAGAPIASITPHGHRRALPADPNAPDPAEHRVASNAAEYSFGARLFVRAIELPTPEQAERLPWDPESKALVVTRSETGLAPPAYPSPVRPLGVAWWPAPAQGRRFNDLGKLVEQVDGTGRRRHWEYDAAGNLALFVDFDGRPWRYDQGAWHFVRSQTDPLGTQVRFTYTTNGDLASCEDGGGTLSEYRYDAKDHLIEVHRHGALRDRYLRDAVGNLIGKHAADGRELLRIEIGPGNLPIVRQLSSGDTHALAYDPAGRLLNASTSADAVEFAYDKIGHRIRDQRNGLGVSHRFKDWGRPAETVIFGRFRIRYDWPREGLLVITDPGGGSHRFEFLPHGLVERRSCNGSTEFAQYDPMGRCLFKLARRRNGQVWQRRYHWSGEGELQTVSDSLHGDVHFEYDAAHRLRRRVDALHSEDYVMDAADNLLAQPGLQDVSLREGNRLRHANGFEFSYNDRNHIAAREVPGGVVRYHYDSRDQLVGAELPDGTWQADYDTLGRRTRKRYNGRTTEYHWSGDQLLAERDGDGRLRLYIYPDPLALTPFVVLDYDSMDAAPDRCRRYMVFADQLGTPVLLEDPNGVDVWSARISPFGAARVDPKSTVGLALRFPGHSFDAELGLHYNRFRYYDPVLGRYLESDPWGIAGGFNIYAYRTNPLEIADVRGLGEENNPDCARQREDRPDGEEPRPPPGFPTEDDVRRNMPIYDGETTRGTLVTNEGHVVPLESGTRPPGYSNYESAAHVEGQAAIFIRENNSTGGVVYHNNPNGTCGYCNSHVPTLLPEGAQMVVVPPEGSRANNSRATGEPTIYTGNDRDPKPPPPPKPKPPPPPPPPSPSPQD